LGAGEGQGELIVGLSLQFHEQISLSMYHYSSFQSTFFHFTRQKRRKKKKKGLGFRA
jgi:hypothetical protein